MTAEAYIGSEEEFGRYAQVCVYSYTFWAWAAGNYTLNQGFRDYRNTGFEDLIPILQAWMLYDKGWIIPSQRLRDVWQRYISMQH